MHTDTRGGRSEPWSDDGAVGWATMLLDSHARLAGRDLVARTGTPLEDARRLWEAPLVVLSHRLSDDPVLVYGNRAALALWGMDWASFTSMPSRLTAEPDLRAERAQALADVARTGITHGYGGVRVTADGRRFRIAGASLWNVLDHDAVVGQAACFPSDVAWC